MMKSGKVSASSQHGMPDGWRRCVRTVRARELRSGGKGDSEEGLHLWADDACGSGRCKCSETWQVRSRCGRFMCGRGPCPASLLVAGGPGNYPMTHRGPLCCEMEGWTRITRRNLSLPMQQNCRGCGPGGSQEDATQSTKVEAGPSCAGGPMSVSLYVVSPRSSLTQPGS
jgi:hypothetical protein